MMHPLDWGIGRLRALHSCGPLLGDTGTEVAIAEGADCVSHIEVFGDRQGVCGPVASMPTTWRMLDRIDEAHVPGVRTARAAARERVWPRAPPRT